MTEAGKSIPGLIFSGDNILVTDDTPARLPEHPGTMDFGRPPESSLEFADGEDIQNAAKYTAVFYKESIDAPRKHRLMHLREYFRTAPAEQFAAVSRAYQVSVWNANTKFCGSCGADIKINQSEYSKRCPRCGLQIFPQIAPAIIIGVIKDNKLLLAHNVKFSEGLYSLVAGFMNPGETIEECAKREVLEETGLHIKNVRYFGSQPWPFPHSLMIGLTGEYESGDITPDGEEITHAQWFTPVDLPNLPGPGSISRKIIDWYIRNH